MNPYRDYPDTPEPWQSEDEFHGGPCRLWWIAIPVGAMTLLAAAALCAFLSNAGWL